MPDILIPVFVFPNNLSFNLLDQSTHKQVLTLYNPYEFPVRYQVLCSARDKHKYTVVDPEGCIQSHSCIDIVIRHNEVSSQNVGQIDKFRIQMYQYSSNKFIGKKDIRAELLAEKEDDHQSLERETFQELPMTNISQAQQQFSLPRRQGRPSAPNGLVVCVALICVTALLLPSHGDESMILPDYLKPTTHLKLVMSYVLGTFFLIKYVLGVPTTDEICRNLKNIFFISKRHYQWHWFTGFLWVCVPLPIRLVWWGLSNEYLLHLLPLVAVLGFTIRTVKTYQPKFLKLRNQHPLVFPVERSVSYQGRKTFSFGNHLFGHDGFIQAKLGPGREVQERAGEHDPKKQFF